MYSFAPTDIRTLFEIADTWKYPRPHDFYDMTADPEDYDESVHSGQWSTHFLEVLEDSELVEFFTPAAAQDSAEIALGMRPDLIGQGKGYESLQSCLNYARAGCGIPETITLNVANFSVRAIRVYAKAGFQVVRRSALRANGSQFDFLEMMLPRPGNSWSGLGGCKL